MDDNVGAIDQTIRIFVGIMAGWEFFLLPSARWWLIAVGCFFILTGAVARCPIYSLLSASTRKGKVP
jgi:hypothetical protein